ncbi:replication-associated recombination protein A [candidate division KSB1 bacterium]
MDLFQQDSRDNSSGKNRPPLAERMRPAVLEDFVGQEHLTGRDGILRQQLEKSSLYSMIFWGPPGCGKTTLARIIAQRSDATFYQISAVTAGVKDVKKIIDAGTYNLKSLHKKTLLFIDEIHRFNKAQQDVLLKSVEEGTLILIGATTENPSFEVIAPLLSRCRIYRLNYLTEKNMKQILDRTRNDDPVMSELNPVITEEAESSLIFLSGGDARIMLNAFEAAAQIVQEDTTEDERKCSVGRKDIEQVLQRKSLLYDKKGEYHYDIISAFIKSVRGSDPDAAVYWMTRMLESGEDPKFIARRMIILASEDIGNADPAALPLATAAFTAVDYVGMPEAAIILSHTASYLASTVKSNASYLALKAAQKEIKESPDAVVPLHLRNAPTAYMASEGYGRGYKYPHEYESGFTNQDYLPEELRHLILYRPTEHGIEKRIKERLEKLWPKRKKSTDED